MRVWSSRATRELIGRVMDGIPILELGKWTRRFAETHVALGRLKAQQIEQWSNAYLTSEEPNVTGAINTANAATARLRSNIARLEHQASAQEAVIDFLRRVTSWDSLPDDDFLPFPLNANGDG